MLIGAGIIALLLSLGGVAYVLLFKDKDPAADAETAESQSNVPALPQPAVYQTLEPPFVVNFNHAGRQRYMQVSVVLLGRDAVSMGALAQHMPLIRNQLVMTFSTTDFAELLEADGREALRDKTTQEIQTLLEREIGSPVIESALFTNLVLQ
ncbi:MAG: flagellar basal body-associated FliL family protein [Halopseudomonas yangmingensis]|nr:flagellar basal body-associated FliL family protein [Halopseudomonas yangmingensis]